MTAVTAERITSAERARRVAAELAAEFAVGAAERDRLRQLPHRETEQLAASGLLGVTVPAFYGGADLPASELAEVVRILAVADPNIAQIPHSHFVYLNLLRLAGSEAQRRRWFAQVLDGARIANAQSERTSATVAEVRTTLRPVDGGRFRIDGDKFYCTGSLFADLLAVLVRLDDPDGYSGLAPGEYVAYLPAESPGVRIVDDWNGLGQRTTGSGTVHFDGVLVDSGQLVERSSAVRAPTAYGSYAQLLHAAIDTGIARGALGAAADFVRTRSRPWFEAGVERAGDDPLVVQRFGELSVLVTTAEATLAAAGLAVDAATAGPVPTGARPSADAATAGVASTGLAVDGAISGGSSGRADGRLGDGTGTDALRGQLGEDYARTGGGVVGEGADDPVARASLAVATAKIVADRAATEVSGALFEVSGTRSAAADLNLDHFWRNARTHTLHDPVRWKYQHLGRAILHGAAPPLHGVI
ncbi:acyl-CoA dehydrogenase family protein [Nocardia terpenica]|uniref:acyl-CoA dehydrogenase family protein n=1 Tax=Nocardia terpenica TaxID=455432 RepID=UPI001895294E|nr:acyl-CoA dehydrogenase family protein [Nocardia terpenica]MBF6062621.1 acyl-CoA dehydrogenase family protein [Nocardia terpenica]MBF6104709.1 acyl-CoA dehydrogenase family protein [Nocardia terpenica]MBF6116456.1 acyl-CoA dehydrogenase family protein [Nocardia terpenica]MBF6123419.1 acyl-CoA dehydrogenase family protein [Nocardia terpenica]MBF6156924.1 acyl-CoA dehydrogenase family protein [Nocardia terpenica]